ncbi:MAG: PTS sugar transporter subunit IIA [Gemmatimonadaceae bacterium]|nr:PTS sugar transporter subunit IIA [Gemmatimonadaceae bacterium]
MWGWLVSPSTHDHRELLSDLLTLERVKVPLVSRSKDEVLRELVRLALPSAGSAALETIVTAVLEREALLSTGIGSGIAIPHGRTSLVETVTLAAGRAQHPIDFDALDGKPVSLFFLLLGPDSAAGAHVRALGRISRILRHEDVRGDLNQAPSPDLFLARLIGAEVP